MSEPGCHVMFSTSAAGTLREALLMAQRPDEVLCLLDNFSFGPIATEKVEDRIHWVEQVLGCTEWEEFSDSSDFLAAFEAPIVSVTVWMSRHESLIYAGFLWWLSHVGDLPVSIIEVDELTTMNAEGMVDLLDCATHLKPKDRARYQGRWQQLKIENAPLRVADGEHLVSAPIEHFDDNLLSYATHEWQKMSRIVGYKLAEFLDTRLHQTCDLVLGARLADLAVAGRLAWRGDLTHMGRCELRLPPN
jgi:Protein of unknown function/Domain of unknown function (DUF1835)